MQKNLVKIKMQVLTNYDIKVNRWKGAVSICCPPLHTKIDCLFVKLAINGPCVRAFTWRWVKWIILTSFIGSIFLSEKRNQFCASKYFISSQHKFISSQHKFLTNSLGRMCCFWKQRSLPYKWFFSQAVFALIYLDW